MLQFVVIGSPLIHQITLDKPCSRIFLQVDWLGNNKKIGESILQ